MRGLMGQLSAVGLGVVLMLAAAILRTQVVDAAQGGPLQQSATAVPTSTNVNSEWPTYGNDSGGSRFAKITQINVDNVHQLEEVWRYQTGDLRSERMAFEATPILVNNLLYVSSPYGTLHALEPATGKIVWQFDSQTPKDRGYSENTSRGVSAWRDSRQDAQGACSRRIFFGTLDARLLALDALTGRPCRDFGVNGVVDLNLGTRPSDQGDYLVSSPPVIWKDSVITGSAVGDNRGVEIELGIVRAFDARSGRLLWTFDPIPRQPENPVFAEWQPAQAQRTGAANAWSVLSLDVERGLVFVPVGSASPDFYGGERLGSNRHANSLVVLDAATGQVRWAQQLVHHDLWDYDLPAQPVLFDLVRDGKKIPAVVQATKMGMLFVFHRETGEPLFEIEERPVPSTDVAGEKISPTQPFSALPSLVPNGPLKAEDAWGFTPLDRNACAEKIASYRSEGIYTPPSLQGTILWPGYAGGSNWGSVSVDSQRQWVFANVNRLPFVVQLIPRADLKAVYESGEYDDSEFARQTGTPYGMRRELIASPLGVPCTAPPWGTLAAVNLQTGKIQWEVPLGTSRDIAPWPVWFIDGVPNMGGSMVTAGGVLFIGATADNFLRAFAMDTGQELWRGRLPAGGQATPMTYVANGKQYVVIAAGGHGGMDTTRGDYVVAFALPNP